MFLEIEHAQRSLLIELVESRISELGPEIRHTRDSKFHDKLKAQKVALTELLQRLHEAEYDVTD